MVVRGGRAHLEQSLALYDRQKQSSSSFVYDPGVYALAVVAHILWLLGYPDQALKRSQQAVSLARELSHSYSLAFALGYAVGLHRMRKEQQAARDWGEEGLTLSTEHGFVQQFAIGTILRGCDIAEQGRGEDGIAQVRQGVAALRATGAELPRSWSLALLAETYGKVGQFEEGVTVLAEALTAVNSTGRRDLDATLYRLKGELVLQSAVHGPQSEIPNTQHPRGRSVFPESYRDCQETECEVAGTARNDESRTAVATTG